MTQKPRINSRTGFSVEVILAIVYIGLATLCATNIIVHTTKSTDAIEKILNTYNLKNESTKTLQGYEKQHPFLSMFLDSPVRKQLDLPSDEKANEALFGDVKNYLKEVRTESSITAWWSWSLLCASLLYVIVIIAIERSFMDRAVLFALNTVALTCFFIGILAPAMVIWTAPVIPMETGNFEYVVQHEIRGILAIILDLFKNDHWIIGGFLFLFSIATPLTKATLTYFVTWSKNEERNKKIGEFLHTIGKWSMADVFVAAILLALYALKFQEATKSIPCLGLYYFIGYCLFSLTTTELMVHSGVVGDTRPHAKHRIDFSTIYSLVAVLIFFAAASGLYTWQQYTENTKQKIESPGSPQKLNNADLVLPVHKQEDGAQDKAPEKKEK